MQSAQLDNTFCTQLDNTFSTFAGKGNLTLFHGSPAVNPNRNQKHQMFSPVHYLFYIPFNNK
jgi:hypothetical protein